MLAHVRPKISIRFCIFIWWAGSSVLRYTWRAMLVTVGPRGSQNSLWGEGRLLLSTWGPSQNGLRVVVGKAASWHWKTCKPRGRAERNSLSVRSTYGWVLLNMNVKRKILGLHCEILGNYVGMRTYFFGATETNWGKQIWHLSLIRNVYGKGQASCHTFGIFVGPRSPEDFLFFHKETHLK